MRDEKGAIALFTLLAMLFFLVFIMIAYNNVSSKARTQIETTEVLADEYISDTSSSALYNKIVTDEKVSEEDLKTDDERNASGSGYIAVNGKVYKIQ